MKYKDYKDNSTLLAKKCIHIKEVKVLSTMEPVNMIITLSKGN